MQFAFNIASNLFIVSTDRLHGSHAAFLPQRIVSTDPTPRRSRSAVDHLHGSNSAFLPPCIVTMDPTQRIASTDPTPRIASTDPTPRIASRPRIPRSFPSAMDRLHGSHAVLLPQRIASTDRLHGSPPSFPSVKKSIH